MSAAPIFASLWLVRWRYVGRRWWAFAGYEVRGRVHDVEDAKHDEERGAVGGRKTATVEEEDWDYKGL